ncbi:MAG TPA: hypothetical protein VFI08_11725 [Spirochaetia bacterium]|nr:hypothetical protein [Spirochaetia bacterium]
MGRSAAQFVRALYFETQTVENVMPLEIWNGVREQHDPFEAASLAKNLLKIVVPLVNEVCTGLPFAAHGRLVRSTLAGVARWYREDPTGRLFDAFPDPPTDDEGQKAVYRAVREAARAIRDKLAPETRGGMEAQPEQGLLPDGLFDFRELRIVDNELPFIIFTEKEYRVIHGLAIVYMWIIEAEEILLEALERDAGVDLVEEYRQFARRVQEENPLTIKGKTVDARAFTARIHEKLRDKDYLDIFEDVHRWYEQTRARYTS